MSNFAHFPFTLHAPTRERLRETVGTDDLAFIAREKFNTTRNDILNIALAEYFERHNLLKPLANSSTDK